MCHANFPLPAGRCVLMLCCTYWDLVSNTWKHSPWRPSFYPATWCTSPAGYVKVVCIPKTPSWCTGNTVLMWTRSMTHDIHTFDTRIIWNTYAYLIAEEQLCYLFRKSLIFTWKWWWSFTMWILKWTDSEVEPAQKRCSTQAVLSPDNLHSQNITSQSSATHPPTPPCPRAWLNLLM